MSQNLFEKLIDRRTRERYLKKGLITQKDLEQHLKALPNDEDNFELTTFTEDEYEGLSDDLTEEEIKNMPPIKEEDIENFDFLDEKDAK